MITSSSYERGDPNYFQIYIESWTYWSMKWDTGTMIKILFINNSLASPFELVKAHITRIEQQKSP